MSNYHERLGTEKISRLLFKQSSPAIIGMLVMTLYNVVDTIFIGRGVGTLALAGVAIAFPVQMIIMAIAQSIGIGASSLISRALGSKNFKKAEKVIGNYLSLIFLISFLVTVLGSIFLTPILKIFGATLEIFNYSAQYMSIILYGTLFLSFAASANNIIRAEGNAKFAMMIMISSALLNIILDPIFIFVFNFGVRGAAIATVIAQLLAGAMAFYYFLRGRSAVKIYFKNFKLKLKIVSEIFAIGSSSLARFISMGLVTAIVNRSLGVYGGDLAIAAFGIINRMMMLIASPLIGIVHGLQPILGYNYGARKIDRVNEVIFSSIKVATMLATMATFVLIVFSKIIIQIFTTDTALIEMTSTAIKIVVMVLPFVGFQFITAGMYQALGKAKPALFLSLLRQVIFLIPFIVILPLFYQLNGIWFSFPVADLMATVVTLAMIYKEVGKLKKLASLSDT